MSIWERKVYSLVQQIMISQTDDTVTIYVTMILIRNLISLHFSKSYEVIADKNVSQNIHALRLLCSRLRFTNWSDASSSSDTCQLRNVNT